MMKLDKMRISFWNCGSLSKSTYVAIVKGLARVSTPKLWFETWFDSKIPKYTAEGQKKLYLWKLWYQSDTEILVWLRMVESRLL